jgi:hypothetical protein
LTIGKSSIVTFMRKNYARWTYVSRLLGVRIT